MPIEQIMIGGRASGKTTKLIEWLKEKPRGKAVLICPTPEHVKVMREKLYGYHVHIHTPETSSRNLRDETKYVGIDELDLMDVSKLDWDNLMKHYLFITGWISDFIFSSILRLADLFPDKTINLPFPSDRISHSELEGMKEDLGKNQFEREFLVSSTPPHDSLTFYQIMKKYHKPFDPITFKKEK